MLGTACGALHVDDCMEDLCLGCGRSECLGQQVVLQILPPG